MAKSPLDGYDFTEAQVFGHGFQDHGARHDYLGALGVEGAATFVRVHGGYSVYGLGDLIGSRFACVWISGGPHDAPDRTRAAQPHVGEIPPIEGEVLGGYFGGVGAHLA